MRNYLGRQFFSFACTHLQEPCVGVVLEGRGHLLHRPLSPEHLVEDAVDVKPVVVPPVVVSAASPAAAPAAAAASTTTVVVVVVVEPEAVVAADQAPAKGAGGRRISQ